MNSLAEKKSFDSRAFYRELEELVKKKQLIKTWFKNVSIELDHNEDIIINTPNEFSRNFIAKRFLVDINRLTESKWDKKCHLSVKECKKPKEPLKLTKNAVQPKEESSSQQHFDHFSFEDYLAGEENQLALIAAKTICRESRAGFHSPFTIIGAHGLGKTHLSSAIARSYKKMDVVHLHAEEFANEFVLALRESKLDAFRYTIRRKKLFVIEDIDFFLEGNKKRTIEELIHTIKVLKRDHRQIVITSTRPCADFEIISPRLVDLLLSGLKVRLKEPDENTRKLYIHRFIKKYKARFAPKSIQLLESIPFKSIRELDGALKQLIAFSILEKDKLPISVVKEVLADHLRNHSTCDQGQGHKDLHSVCKIVCKFYGVAFSKLISSSRERHVCLARHTAMHLCNHLHHYTLMEIGNFFGGKPHQSVIYALQKINEKRKKDLEFNKLYDKLCQQLK